MTTTVPTAAGPDGDRPVPAAGDTPGTPAARAGRSAYRDPSVDDQLARLEQRLLSEVGEDPDLQRRVLTELADVRSGFADATVRRFLPILVEREVRRRLAAEAPAMAVRPRAPGLAGR